MTIFYIIAIILALLLLVYMCMCMRICIQVLLALYVGNVLGVKSLTKDDVTSILRALRI